MDQSMTRCPSAGKSRRMSSSAGVAAIGLAIQLLTAPATGLTSLPLPSLGRKSSSTPSSSRRCSENPLMTMQRPFPCSTPGAATATTAVFGDGGGTTPVDTITGWSKAPAPQRRLRRNLGRSPHISRPSVWGEGVRRGAGRGDAGGGEGGASNDKDEAGDPAGGDRRYGPGDGESPMAEKQAVGSDDNGSPMGSSFSFSALEDELRTRSAKTTETRRADVVRGGGAGGAEGEESAWWPRILPPPLPGQGDDDSDPIQPLIELPLDGVLLQLFPALLIGVAGLILTVAVQTEAGRFDAMVGENGGAVVVTDLRDTGTQQQQQSQQQQPQQQQPQQQQPQQP